MASAPVSPTTSAHYLAPTLSEPCMISGALMSPDDPDDYIYERTAHGADGYYTTEMPAEYDLRQHARPARDQGERSTCAAFAAACIKEIQENRDCGLDCNMSPEFIYYHRENKPGSGMFGRNVFQILREIGSVPESAYPYRCDDNASPPGADIYALAAKYRISNFARVTTVNGLKRALLEIGPCYMQLPLYLTRPEFWRAGVGEPESGHAIAVVGYTEDGFILENSWGPEWNGDGCVIFPYDEWGVQWECWVSVDEKTLDTALTPTTQKKKGNRQTCIVC